MIFGLKRKEYSFRFLRVVSNLFKLLAWSEPHNLQFTVTSNVKRFALLN